MQCLNDDETWAAYLGFRLVYFFVLAVIYEMIKHRLRTVCCRLGFGSSGTKRARSTGINTEAEVHEGTGHCVWITTASGRKFKTTGSCRYTLNRPKNTHEKCIDCERPDGEVEETMLRARP